MSPCPALRTSAERCSQTVLLLALTLGVDASALDAGAAVDSTADLPGRFQIGDQASRRAIIDAASLAWRMARNEHAPWAPPPIGSAAVSNCNDHGSGSLREAIENAVSGDTIDLTSMGCSEITLTTGALVVLQDRLTLQVRPMA